MSSDDISSSKTSSPFLSLFSRKKRITTSKSSDDNKAVNSSTLISLHNGNGQPTTTTTNGYIDLENSELPTLPVTSASTSWAQESHQPLHQQPQEQTASSFSFTDRVRYHRSYRKYKRTGLSDVTDEVSCTGPLPNSRSRSESRTIGGKSPILLAPKKAYSVDTMNQADSAYLMEALETLADTQPRVARSIPKHAVIDTSNFAMRSLDNCLFDAEVYDAMLHDSIKVCEMLQKHLSQCIVTVRAKSPDGLLETLTEESEDDSTSTIYTQERSKRVDSRELSVEPMNSTPTLSTDGTCGNQNRK